MASSQKLKLETSHTSTTFNPQVSWVPKLEGENYEQWSVQMKSIFIAQGIWDIIQHGRPEIPNDDDEDEEAPWDETKRESYNLNTRRDHYALSIIHRGVDETILPDILDATTAREAWRILETRYKKLKQVQTDDDGAKSKDAVSSLLNKLKTLPKTRPNHCIYMVPEHLRKVKRECFEPSVVSIGPIHYKKSSYLKYSQELKLKHLECFLLEGDNNNNGDFENALKHYISIVEKWHDEARSCYEEKINLSREEFIEMMIIDAAFIIICVIGGFIFMNSALKSEVLQDMFLQDNQLPFFVLEKLYDIAFGRLNSNITFKDLTCSFICNSSLPVSHASLSSRGKDNVKNAEGIIHLVDFLRLCCLPPERSGPTQNREKRNCLCCLPAKFNLYRNQLSNLKNNIQSRICCFSHKNNSPDPNQNSIENDDDNSQFPKFSVKELEATGVKFKAIYGQNLLDIKFENGVLQIPALRIQDTTEAFLRNIVCFEQCHYYLESYLIDYVAFLDALIDTSEDVKILIKHGIIINYLGSEDELATMVNRLTTHMTIYTPNFYYLEISQRLNEHASKRWNRWRAILKRDYFNHPWSSLSVCYLVILLILTILQVYTGFKQ